MGVRSIRKIFLFLSIFFSIPIFAQTFNPGTGVLGACTQATFVTGGTYNCASVTISADCDVVGGGALVIKSTGAVTISAALKVNGGLGEDGGKVPGAGQVVVGGIGGPGGLVGGSCDGDPDHLDCLPPLNDGSGLGGGAGGETYTGFDTIIIGGGGGGGGGHGLAGTTAVQGITAGGGVGGLGGIGGTVFGDENNFENIFSGGAGGGGGGLSQKADTSIILGAGGGGGGGAIRIEAAGIIHITGAGRISANGGVGGNGDIATPGGGAGGGGAGGAIFLQSAIHITLDAAGLLTVDGGNGGDGQGVGDGDGGAGGRGRIRLDDSDGAVANAPAFSVIKTLTTGSASQQILESDISCGTILLDLDSGNGTGPGNLVSLIVGFLFISLISRWQMKALRRFSSFLSHQ